MTTRELHPIEVATPADAEAINRLAVRSVLGLHPGHYDDAQIEAAIEQLHGVDQQLLLDRTYFVIRCGGKLAAVGGWSWRSTILGAHGPEEPAAGALDPATDPARIRGFYVDPDHAGAGHASRLLELSEEKARDAGFSAVALASSVKAIGFYLRHGYIHEGAFEVPLRGGGSLTSMRMRKRL